MGNRNTSLMKRLKDSEYERESDAFEINEDNGYVFCKNYYIPEEVLSMILSYLPPRDLVFVCRRVCKYWCNVIDSQVWKIILTRNNVPLNKVYGLSWVSCYWIAVKLPLNKNLVKNNCGQEKLEHWEILSSGGDGWVIEKPPHGCENFPHECESEKVLEQNSCFTTSFYSCSKRQLIDLRKEGATPEFMDKVQPHIAIADWFTGRADCSAIYELKVKLLNESNEPLDNYEVRKSVGLADGSSWQKASYVFQGYGPGVRYIEFYHGGVDSQFWKGHYGSKMTGGSVVLSLP